MHIFIVKTGTHVYKMLSRLNQIGNPSDYVPSIKILHDKLRSKLVCIYRVWHCI